mgnify:CR=1 FL=1
MFKAYLASRRVNDSLQGTFTRDALSDPNLPDPTAWPELKRYLMRCGHSHAIEAAQLVWAAYRAKLWRDRKDMVASTQA